jgi:hypothetical protein
MSGRLQIHQREHSADTIELAATLHLRDASHRLWWRAPASSQEMLTTFADPFVIATSFLIMSAGEDVEVEAPVSRSLLAGLESYMDIWRAWVPGLYRRARVWSKEEAEPPVPGDPEAFVVPFSAGVDSCFTALRHARDFAGRNRRRVGLGVTMFGFDIRADDPNASAMYDHVAAGAATMLQSLHIPHIQVSTNFRSLPGVWLHTHGAQLVSTLSLFGGGFGGALVPNSLPANHLGILWGSHPYSDPFLSSERFKIIDDGGAVPRWQKVKALIDWPEAMDGLRVCFGVAGEAGNCGRCEKCIRTAIAFLINDAMPGASLPAAIPASRFRGIRLKHPLAIGFWNDLLDGIVANGKQHEPWARGVRSVLARARRHQLGKAARQPFLPLRNKIRKLFRGSTLSQKQLNAQRVSDKTMS